MKCTSCNSALDKRKKNQYVYASYALRSSSFVDRMFNKDYWVFCSNRCKTKADQDWMQGTFEKLHGNKKIDFKP